MTVTASASQSLPDAPEGYPRIGPLLSATSDVDRAYRAAQRIGLDLFPWQQYALDLIYSADEQHRWKYREVAIIAARQNGKSEILVPLILDSLERGERVLHTAQDRQLPREVFEKVAAHAIGDIRRTNGQESIRHPSGGRYTILAPQKSFRGRSADRLIIDEVREQKDFELIRRAEPTISASTNPQVIYLSNAGDETSLVLNELKDRGTSDDPGDLAYAEWSADPDLAVDDQRAWKQANPSVGFQYGQSMRILRSLHHKYTTAGELSIFETEHLCRWVVSMLPRLVQDSAWQMCRGYVETPNRPAMGINVDPSGKRASAALAWKQSDGTIGLLVSAEVTGNPINVVDLAVDLTAQAQAAGVEVVAYDPWTDEHLARHFPNTEKINSSLFANASERFVRAVETQAIRWQQADSISSDLPYVARKSTSGGAWMADRADPDRSITAALAAIRAVWMASNPQVQVPSVY
jgi:hypothetical protein